MAHIDPLAGKIDEKTGFHAFTDKEHAEAVEKAAKVGAGTHRATACGYGAGDVLVEVGQTVPAGTPVSTEWMERVDGKAEPMMKAVEAALNPQPDDIDYTKLSKAALEGMCAERSIPTDGLSVKQMIDVLKASHDPTR